MRTITASRTLRLDLGRQGEHLAQCIRFPETVQWKKEYPEGVISLWHRRPTETTQYPCELVFDEDGVAIWNITATDTQMAQEKVFGKAELHCVDGDIIVKSRTYETKIFPSLGGEQITPPEAVQTWVDRISTAAVSAEQSAKTAAEAKAYIEANLGDMHAVLDEIIAMQESYIGGSDT